MDKPQTQSLLEFRIVSGTTVISFLDSKALMEEGKVQACKTAFLNFMENMGHRQFHLCLNNAPTLCSSALAMLVLFRQKLANQGGKMTMSGVSKEVMEVFQVTKLDSFFTMAEEPKAPS